MKDNQNDGKDYVVPTTRQEIREHRLLKNKSSMKKHGRNFVSIYPNIVLKRLKQEQKTKRTK